MDDDGERWKATHTKAPIFVEILQKVSTDERAGAVSRREAII